MTNKLPTQWRLKISAVSIGVSIAVILFFVLGMLTVLIKNQFFIRMTPVHWYDYVFLILTSMLSGAYVGLWRYNKNNDTSISNKCNYAAAGGAAGGLFSFGCAICNKLLIFLLGVSGVITYFMPLQPFFGVIGVVILGYAVYMQSKNQIFEKKKTIT